MNTNDNAPRRNDAMRKTPNTASYDWLMGRDKNGERRIETLSWKRIARIYRDSQPGSQIRKAINAECRRLGYAPRKILGING